jgi:hypothetical protein
LDDRNAVVRGAERSIGGEVEAVGEENRRGRTGRRRQTRQAGRSLAHALPVPRQEGKREERIDMGQLIADLFTSLDGHASGEGAPAYFGYP